MSSVVKPNWKLEAGLWEERFHNAAQANARMDKELSALKRRNKSLEEAARGALQVIERLRHISGSSKGQIEYALEKSLSPEQEKKGE